MGNQNSAQFQACIYPVGFSLNSLAPVDFLLMILCYLHSTSLHRWSGSLTLDTEIQNSLAPDQAFLQQTMLLGCQ